MVKKSFLLGMGFSFLLIGCAGISFPYRFYGLELPSYAGKILGPESKYDLDFKVCEPDQYYKGKCILMLSDAAYALKKDYLDTKQKLIECQGN